MGIILVSDVFGKTPALERLAKELNANKIVDPYDGKCMNFLDENEAYLYFIDKIGLDTYLKKLKLALKSNNMVVTLIGFSVGASTVWRLSGTSSNKYIKNAICFYGSQIRNFAEIKPTFNVKLIFPKSELHFDVEKLRKELDKKKKVNTNIVNYLHGFMNCNSINYDKKAYLKHIELLRLEIN